MGSAGFPFLDSQSRPPKYTHLGSDQRYKSSMADLLCLPESLTSRSKVAKLGVGQHHMVTLAW